MGTHVSPRSTLPAEAIVIGIDWADQTHAVCLIDPQHPRPRQEQLAQQPAAIQEWAARLRQQFPGRELCVVVEQSRGALFHALLATGCFTLFPVNPKQLARYREAVYPSGGKNDPDDAELLARFFLHHPDQVRPCRPDAEPTRRLANLTELRRKLVEERKRVALQLASTLTLYFPLLLELFRDRLEEPLVTKLLQRWPTLPLLRRAHPAALQKFFREHGIRQESRRDELIAAIRTAVDLTTDKALLEPSAAYAQSLARQLDVLVTSIAQFDATIQAAVAAHEDAPIFRSLPGAGAVLVPRLIAAFGSDRERYQSAEELQAYSGTAPITKQSGKSRTVQRRRACPRFLKQTFHEFADHSRRWSRWAKAWYERKRAAGMKHHAAVRALAYKWIRILFQLWKNRETYSEERYIQALIRAGSPIAELIQNPKLAT